MENKVNLQKKFKEDSKTALKKTKQAGLIIITAPIWLPIVVVVGAVMLITLPITIPSGFWRWEHH